MCIAISDMFVNVGISDLFLFVVMMGIPGALMTPSDLQILRKRLGSGKML